MLLYLTMVLQVVQGNSLCRFRSDYFMWNARRQRPCGSIPYLRLHPRMPASQAHLWSQPHRTNTLINRTLKRSSITNSSYPYGHAVTLTGNANSPCILIVLTEEVVRSAQEHINPYVIVICFNYTYTTRIDGLPSAVILYEISICNFFLLITLFLNDIEWRID